MNNTATVTPPVTPPVTPVTPVTSGTPSVTSGTPSGTPSVTPSGTPSGIIGAQDCDCKNGWLDKIVLVINNYAFGEANKQSFNPPSFYLKILFCIVVIGAALYFIITEFLMKEGFGEDTKEENSKKVKIDEVERQLQDRITNINTNLTSLKTRMDNADIMKDNKPTNLAIAIQNNILAVKEAMMKIIAGLVIQTKMNNGALNVVSQTNAFQKNMTDSINNLTNPT
jgi:hypothetical protein